jgi:two-component system sensor histidine kinase KdpD
MAAAQGAAWVAVSVESSRPSRPRPRRLDQNLALARELGAESSSRTTRTSQPRSSASPCSATPRRSSSASPGASRWLDSGARRQPRRSPAPAQRPLDLYVVPAERAAGRAPSALEWDLPAACHRARIRRSRGVPRRPHPRRLVPPLARLPLVGLLYLLATIALSLRVGRWPVLPPAWSARCVVELPLHPAALHLRDREVRDGMMFATYFVVALVAGQLTARIRAQERHERLREERATALLQLTQALAPRARSTMRSSPRCGRPTPVRRQTALLLDRTEGRPHAALRRLLHADGKGARRGRLGVAQSQESRPLHRHAALRRGISRAARPRGCALGVLVVRVAPEHTLTLAQRDLVESFAAQLALLVETRAPARRRRARETARRIRETPPRPARRRLARTQDAARRARRRRRKSADADAATRTTSPAKSSPPPGA